MNENITSEPGNNELLAQMVTLQKKSNTLQIILIVLAAVIALTLIVTSVLVVPKAINVLNDLDGITGTLETSIGEIGDAFESASEVINKNMDSISDVLKKVNELDIESLNSSIENLSGVLESLSKIGSIFK